MLRLVKNPPNPFHSSYCDWLDTPETRTEVFEEKAKSIITENKSPDIAFSYSVNPYRGCFHACAYCYARPSHQYLDFGAGTDFERKIIVKTNAPELLEKEFMRSSWKGERIVFSGITDCYQPLEASYHLTRGCLEVCAKFRNPVAIITKSAIIRKDIDVLTKLNERSAISVSFSIPFFDDELSMKLEPGAPRSSTRFRAMKALAEAGIPVGIGVAPIIPGLSDEQIVKLLQKAKECGATFAFRTMLRLPAEVKDVFRSKIEEQIPEKAQKIFGSIRDMRGGNLNNSNFGHRMAGEGERWKAIEWLFDQTCQRLGLNDPEKKALRHKTRANFERPNQQLRLPGL